MKDNKSSARAIEAGIAAIILLAGITTYPTLLLRTAIAQPMSSSTTTGAAAATTTAATTVNNTQHTVAVGGGNLSMSINQFSPSSIDIHRGESVTFYAPPGSTELHNVVLDLSNATAISSIKLAFILPSGVSSEAFQLAPPDNFGQPIVQNLSDGRQVIIALNKVLFYPSTVNQNGDITYLQENELLQKMEQATQGGSPMSPLSVNYTIQGNEKIVSSGLIFDVAGFAPLEQGQGQQEQSPQQQQQQPLPATADQAGQSPPPSYPILSSFTVTFNEPGTYHFFCAFHPGMEGVVNVTG
jgi:plastocyanin